MAALWTEACPTFPTLDALKEGYEVYAVGLSFEHWRAQSLIGRNIHEGSDRRRVRGCGRGSGRELGDEFGPPSERPAKTLAEHAEDWVDRAADTRSHIGQSGTWTLEQGNHIAASAAFGFDHGPSVNADPPCRRGC